MPRFRSLTTSATLCWLAACCCGPLFSAEPRDLFGLPDGAVKNDGALVIAGGGNLPEEVYDEFVKLAGGKQARLVIIPSAYPFSSMAHVRRVYAGWLDYDAASIEFVDAHTSKQADESRNLRLLKQATGVWLCGGAQGRLYDIFGGTKAHQAIKDVVARGGVVGGTSAGASIMSEVMIREGSARQAVVDRGFGLTRHVVVDQHFYQRGRQERLFGVLAEYPRLVGVGIDEDTAVILRRNQLRAIGAGKISVCLIDPDEDDAGLEWVCRMKDGDVTELLAADGDGDAPEFLEVQRVAQRK